MYHSNKGKAMLLKNIHDTCHSHNTENTENQRHMREREKENMDHR